MMTRENRASGERLERRRAGSERRDALHRSGGEFSTIVVPGGVHVFQPKAGVYKIDIIPYEVGEGNPYADKGYWYYERTFWVHRGVGVNNESVICMAKTFGEKCAVCDYRAKLAKDPNSDEAVIAALKPRERQLWLVYDHGEPEKGVQLWESSYHTFGRLLERRRQGADEDEDHIKNFDDWKAGSTLRVMFSEEDAGGYAYLNAVSIDFKPRPKGLDESLLDHGICLDGLLKRADYEQVRRILMQMDDVEEESDRSDAVSKKPARTELKEVKSKGKEVGWEEEEEEEEEKEWVEDFEVSDSRFGKRKEFGVKRSFKGGTSKKSEEVEDEDDEWN